jgi:hypothetical protein
VIQATQHDIEALLAETGAHPPRHGRGKWICPECQRPALSVNLDKQVFNCFHGGCEFHGGIGTLRKRLGMHREWLPDDEYRRLRRKRERARDAAQRLAGAVRCRREGLLDRLRSLNQLEVASHGIGPTEAAWQGLGLTYADRPKVLSELVILENATACDLIRFFLASEEIRKEKIGRVLSWGGFYPDGRESFVEVNI